MAGRILQIRPAASYVKKGDVKRHAGDQAKMLLNNVFDGSAKAELKDLNRRDFLKGSSSIAASASLVGTSKSWAGANDRLRVAAIGAGGRGAYLMRQASQIRGVEVVTLCDPDERRMAELGAELQKSTGRTPRREPDLRRVLDDRDIDAVTIATCNHWHAPAAIWACQAGKHVYVEKPVSHSIWEGRRLVEAARKYNRCVQGGTQWNSSGRMRKVVQLLHEGVIGDIYMCRAVLLGPRDSIGFKAPEAPPSWLHWDLWLGPAPEQSFHRNLVHYKWHWFWDFGDGEMGNNGSHALNLARWALRKGLPAKVHSVGGRCGYKDQAQTPNTQTTAFEYDDGTILASEIRGLYTAEDRAGSSWHFYGSKGYLYLHEGGECRIRQGRQASPPESGWELGHFEPPARQEQDVPDPGKLEDINHYGNFVDAIRAGKPEMLTAEIEQLHLSCALCHLGNISYRLGRELRFDPRNERFIDDSEADQFLKRGYRKPYVVAEKI